MEAKRRVLPEGLQAFEDIKQRGALYVDKTEMIWNLAHARKFNYLSRPRRFGKSLLLSTMACYFQGKKELFEGLKIMELETEWTVRPVIRLDMNGGGSSEATLKSYMDNTLSIYEEEYDIEKADGASFGTRFRNIIRKAVKETGQKVVILIDEYDSPLLNTWGTPEHEPVRTIYRDLFNYLKIEDDNEYFVFLTGITKFAHVSIFSALNNLNNISFNPQYATLCGMTRDEIVETFSPEIDRLAKENNWSRDEALAKMKEHYDGYHFSRKNMVDVYNPYSVVLALANRDISNYWIDTGPTSLLPTFIDNFEFNIDKFDGYDLNKGILESSDVAEGEDALFLYQSGYITIKGFDDIGDAYILGYPNTEVREALYRMVIPNLKKMKSADRNGTMVNLRRGLVLGDLDKAKTAFQALMADVPYSNISLQAMKMEERYRFIMTVYMKAIGMDVQPERQMATGRIDIVAKNHDFIYVFELKLVKAGGADKAEEQIASRDYAKPFAADGRKVIPLAVELDDEGHGLIDWRLVRS